MVTGQIDICITTENLSGLPCSRVQIQRVLRFVQLWVNAFTP